MNVFGEPIPCDRNVLILIMHTVGCGRDFARITAPTDVHTTSGHQPRNAGQCDTAVDSRSPEGSGAKRAKSGRWVCTRCFYTPTPHYQTAGSLIVTHKYCVKNGPEDCSSPFRPNACTLDASVLISWFRPLQTCFVVLNAPAPLHVHIHVSLYCCARHHACSPLNTLALYGFDDAPFISAYI